MADRQLQRPMSRRRFIRISAAAAAGLAVAPPAGTAAAAGNATLTSWRGLTLGALTSIEIRHPDRARAERALTAAAREAERLAALFTLYHPGSALARLNAAGRLEAPAADLVRLLSEARALGDLTSGTFDVSVQPLWLAYAAHFLADTPTASGPPADALRRAADRVDYRAIEIEPASIRLARDGMALTLNGIAPGYLTDRVVELLKNEGFDSVLVDLGEIRASGTRDGREPWRAGIRDPLADDRIAREVPLLNQALATSAPGGFRFDAAGQFHHIFDPRTGSCPQRYAGVSVVAPTATLADALATASLLMPPEAIAASLRAASATRAILTDRAGATTVIEA